MRVTPDVTVDKVNVSEFDVVVVVGGPGSPQYLWKNTAVLSAVRDAYEQGKVVGGICMSAAVLANAGVLEGKRATVFATDETLQALEDGGAEYVSEDVVVDGMVVTAEGPNAAEEFGDRILKLALAKT